MENPDDKQIFGNERKIGRSFFECWARVSDLADANDCILPINVRRKLRVVGMCFQFSDSFRDIGRSTNSAA